MTNFSLADTVARIDRDAQPKGNYGCVYELWQKDRNREAYDLLSSVPVDHYEEVLTTLKEKGVIVDLGPLPDGLCIHWLDENTCPCGCFDGDAAAA